MSSSGYKVFQTEPIDFILDPTTYEDTSNTSYSDLYIPSNESIQLPNSTNDEKILIDINNVTKTRPKTSKVLRNGVALYQHSNFKGYVTFVYEEGSFSIEHFKSLGMKNDDISSVRIAPGWSVTLYEHHKQTGENITLIEDESALQRVKWNDRVSSFIVKRVGILAPKHAPSTVFTILHSQYKDATVSILCKKNGGFFIGSGFIISHNGYMVTAAHNIITDSINDRPTVIIATISNVNGEGLTQRFNCEVIGIDGSADVAVLKVDLFNHTYFHWGRSRENVIGSQICTFGNPKGQDFQSFTAGYVRDNRYSYKGMIESVAVDAQIYEGCSGSPILDIHGQVIGLVCFGVRGGDGFSWGIAQYMMEPIVQKIIKEKKNLLKPALNFQWNPVDAYFLHKINAPMSTVVEGVYCVKDSPDGKIKKNDIIIKINNEMVQNNSIVNHIWFLEPGSSISVELRRQGETGTRTVQNTLVTLVTEKDLVTLTMNPISQHLIFPMKLTD